MGGVSKMQEQRTMNYHDAVRGCCDMNVMSACFTFRPLIGYCEERRFMIVLSVKNSLLGSMKDYDKALLLSSVVG